ncbi:hypothetical protein [Allomuricauda sp. R78024]|uniref:hypothetical protein n=1 Tax=Allomuricauda sp. R78024 TaxID=3093867 RepID=UPI0037C70531
MIREALEGIVVIVLLLIFVQDLKHRAIHITLPVLVAAIGLYFFISEHRDYTIIGYNFFFLLITFVGLYLYLVIKNNKIINLFLSVGVGDLLFFVAVIPYFSTINYILYFITGMMFSILVFIIIKILSKTELVPLAGLLAIYFMILKGIFYWMNLDFFNNNIL